MHFLTDPASLEMGVVAWYVLAFFTLVGPLVALRAHRRMAAGGGQEPLRRGRIAVYVGSFLWLWILLVLAWAAAREIGLDLFPSWTPSLVDLVVGVVSLALGMLTLHPAVTGASPVARARLHAVVPRDGKEHGAFYLLCATAGFGEEVVYRGVLFSLWATVTGSWWIAALLSAAVFGVVHAYQGPRAAVVAGLYGLRDHVVVGLTGTLWVAIGVHVLHDAIVGTIVGRRVRREEGPPEPARPPVDALAARLGEHGVAVDEATLDEVRRQLDSGE